MKTFKPDYLYCGVRDDKGVCLNEIYTTEESGYSNLCKTHGHVHSWFKCELNPHSTIEHSIEKRKWWQLW